MSEIKYVTGKTVEEAMASAYAEYGNERDVFYEIVEMPKKGFLGLGSTPAKIKVSYETEDASFELESIVSELKNLRFTTDRGYGDYDSDTSNEAKAEVKTEAKAEAAPAKNDNKQRSQKNSNANQAKNEQKQKSNEEPKQPKSEHKAKEKTEIVVTPEEMAFAVEFAQSLIANMHIDAKVVQTGEARIDIIGDNTSILIGHHGETLDAIQYLVNLSVCRRSGSGQREFVKIVVDIENYRAKREETLRSLARRMAAKAVKYKRNIVLEPMNPYERRIIHSEIQDIENVSTHSVGSDENRKIVISYEGADKVERRSRHSRKSSSAN